MKHDLYFLACPRNLILLYGLSFIIYPSYFIHKQVIKFSFAELEYLKLRVVISCSKLRFQVPWPIQTGEVGISPRPKFYREKARSFSKSLDI